MSLFIVDALPLQDPDAERAIEILNPDKVLKAENMRLSPCTGCNACWLKTPGVCAVKDDYEQLLKGYLGYDTTVFLSGTALGFVDYKMKNIADRLLPLATMYTYFVEGEMRHIPRYKKEYRFGLLYKGEADGDYLNRWLYRTALNMRGVSLGAFPIGMAKEAFSCTL
ncbi:MAG: flavodoxin family protein [Clostridia bacterium]|nr:flavodoxin family protein [Clostridia bacterium]